MRSSLVVCVDAVSLQGRGAQRHSVSDTSHIVTARRSACALVIWRPALRALPPIQKATAAKVRGRIARIGWLLMWLVYRVTDSWRCSSVRFAHCPIEASTNIRRSMSRRRQGWALTDPEFHLTMAVRVRGDRMMLLQAVLGRATLMKTGRWSMAKFSMGLFRVMVV